MQAHLIGQAGHAQARQAARHAHRMQPIEQLQRAVFRVVGQRGLGHRPEAQQHGLRQPAALQHVQPVGQQRGSLGGWVAPGDIAAR